MNELPFDIKQKYPTFDITPQHLGHVIRDNNQTRKRTRHEHFPKERYVRMYVCAYICSNYHIHSYNDNLLYL